jgi:uncharacterized phage-associated protein
MAARVRNFDPAKAIETILFVAERLEDPTFHTVSKVLYFADKEHLQRYGRLICGDDYVAMKHGPVPSRIYDMMKFPVGRSVLPEQQANSVNEAFLVYNAYCIGPKRSADEARLSPSEIECLLDSIRQYGNKSFDELTELSHDQAWDSADENDLISVEEIARTLPNSEELLEYLRS